jgi:hypothetical protein
MIFFLISKVLTRVGRHLNIRRNSFVHQYGRTDSSTIDIVDMWGYEFPQTQGINNIVHYGSLKAQILNESECAKERDRRLSERLNLDGFGSVRSSISMGLRLSYGEGTPWELEHDHPIPYKSLGLKLFMVGPSLVGFFTFGLSLLHWLL